MSQMLKSDERRIISSNPVKIMKKIRGYMWNLKKFDYFCRRRELYYVKAEPEGSGANVPVGLSGQDNEAWRCRDIVVASISGNQIA